MERNSMGHSGGGAGGEGPKDVWYALSWHTDPVDVGRVILAENETGTASGPLRRAYRQFCWLAAVIAVFLVAMGAFVLAVQSAFLLVIQICVTIACLRRLLAVRSYRAFVASRRPQLAERLAPAIATRCGPTRLEVGSLGVRFEMPGTVMVYEWAALSGVRRAAEHVVFELGSKGLVWPMPESACDGVTRVEALVMRCEAAIASADGGRRAIMAALKVRAATCGKCKHEVFGVSEPRCPECGSRVGMAEVSARLYEIVRRSVKERPLGGLGGRG